MSRKFSLLLLGVIPISAMLSLGSSSSAIVNYDYIADSEAHYIASCVVSSGAMITSPRMLSTFRGTPHYEICPYFSNFATVALLDDPTPANLLIVKRWMKWVFNHLNPDGSIYDYYVDKLNGGTELPSIEAYPREHIPDYDSKDSYAATFLTLARRYVEVVPADTSWLRKYSRELQSVGEALYSVVDDSNHHFHSDNNDELTVAKSDYQVKYTMDNSEVNEGLRDMVWLEKNVIANGNPSFYQRLLDNNSKGFTNLWDSSASAYYSYEGSSSPDWNEFYPDATCQLFPIWTGVISLSSSRASHLYGTFNSHYPDWQTGKYHGDLGTIACYVAALMNDQSRANEYLSYVQESLDKGKNPPGWFNAAAAWTLRAAERMRNPK